jgi:hypothetical protein
MPANCTLSGILPHIGKCQSRWGFDPLMCSARYSVPCVSARGKTVINRPTRGAYELERLKGAGGLPSSCSGVLSARSRHSRTWYHQGYERQEHRSLPATVRRKHLLVYTEPERSRWSALIGPLALPSVLTGIGWQPRCLLISTNRGILGALYAFSCPLHEISTSVDSS